MTCLALPAAVSTFRMEPPPQHLRLAREGVSVRTHAVGGTKAKGQGTVPVVE